MDLNLSDDEVYACFALCQQTKEADVEKLKLYNKLVFIEYLECVCRMLFSKYKNRLERPIQTALNDMPKASPGGSGGPQSVKSSPTLRSRNSSTGGIVSPSGYNDKRDSAYLSVPDSDFRIGNEFGGLNQDAKEK